MSAIKPGLKFKSSQFITGTFFHLSTIVTNFTFSQFFEVHIITKGKFYVMLLHFMWGNQSVLNPITLLTIVDVIMLYSAYLPTVKYMYVTYTYSFMPWLLFYRCYDDVKVHFREDHYLCEEDECAQVEFTNAFRSDLDLKAHKAQYHLRGVKRYVTVFTRVRKRIGHVVNSLLQLRFKLLKPCSSGTPCSSHLRLMFCNA